MDDTDWALWVHDVITGAPVQRFAPVSSSRSTSLFGDGASTETIVVNDAEQPWEPGQVASMFKPNARMLVRWWGGTPLYAHKIEDWGYNRDSGQVTVKGCDLLGEADWRMVGPVSAAGGLTLDVVNRTASGAIAQTLARMMQWAPDWEFPIDLPADASGSVSGSWPFWKKHRISDILKQIQDRAGVEIYLRPYAAGDGGVRFQTRVGAPITIGSSLFSLDADETPLAAVGYHVDGKKQVTGLLGVGNGSGEDQETKWRGGIINVPIRDTKLSFPDMTGTALDEATGAYYGSNVNPLVQWSVGSFTIGDGWTPEHAAPGRVWQLESHGDPVIPDGLHNLRVIKVSGGNGRELKTEVQSAA